MQQGMTIPRKLKLWNQFETEAAIGFVPLQVKMQNNSDIRGGFTANDT